MPAARLHDDDEIVRRPLGPRRECRRLRQPVKGVVHLDRGEPLGVVLQPAFLGQLLGIEAPLPVFVLPAGGSDPERRQLTSAHTCLPPARCSTPHSSATASTSKSPRPCISSVPGNFAAGRGGVALA